MRAADIALAIEGLSGQEEEEEQEALHRDNTFRRKAIYKPSKQTESDNFITPKARALPPEPQPGTLQTSSSVGLFRFELGRNFVPFCWIRIAF